MKRRILTLLLCLCMLVSLFPTGALAGSGDDCYLVLGDSISSGYAPSGTAITPFADQIDTAYELQNKAEEGETSASLLEKL